MTTDISGIITLFCRHTHDKSIGRLEGLMTIARVAKSAGVSQATVSRVINKRPGVSADIIRAVREAMGALGYKPPPLERRPGRRVSSLIDEATGTVGVVLLDNLYQFTPGIFVSHLRGIDLEAADHGMGTIVAHADEAVRLPASLQNGQIKGLILMGSRGAPQLLRSLERFASVWLSSHHGPDGDTVLAGNHAISKLAAEYLIGRGHKHLAFLAVMSSYPAYPARAEAFSFLAAQAGVTADILMDATTGSPDEEFPSLAVLDEHIRRLVDRLLALSPRPTGLFVANDMMTALCYVALRARGVVPGRDVDIISCNNEVSYLVGLDPRPATIDIGAEMVGRRSVEQLLRKLRRPEETRTVQIGISPVLVDPAHL